MDNVKRVRSIYDPIPISNDFSGKGKIRERIANKAFNHEGQFTVAEISKNTKASISHTRRVLNELLDLKLVYQVGNTFESLIDTLD